MTKTDSATNFGGSGPLSAGEIGVAVQSANIPPLVMIVYQFTGDRAWLSDRYRPARIRGLNPRTDGGLSPEAQAEVRAAAVPVIVALSAGEEPAITTVDGDEMAELISFFLGEDVDSRYGPMLGAEIERRSKTRGAPLAPPVETPAGLRAAVIGLGLAGLAAVNMLQTMGIEDYTVFERGDDVGGVWSVNKYPGAGVDTPSHLYTFSFAYQDWARHFELRDELHAYFVDVFDRLQVREHVRFGTEVIRLDYDENTAIWTITAKEPSGATETHTANIVLSTVGALNKPKLPQLPGLDAFRGQQFHSTHWPDDIDLSDKHVAIVGAGASSQQIAPAISSRAANVTIYQRSPQWVAPFPLFRQEIGESQRRLLASTPLFHAWAWLEQFWQFGDTVIHHLRIDPTWQHLDRSVNERNEGQRRFFTRYIEEKLENRPDLVAKAVPDYPPFGKRILLDNGWYDTLKRDNVELVTNSVTEVDATGITDSQGQHRDVDVIVWATGFHADRFLDSIDVYGRGGRRLRDTWGTDDPRAYLGVSVPHFPNFFMLGGPGSFPGSGSVMYVTEVQARYVRELLGKMFAEGTTAISVTEELNDRYNAEMDELHARTVWSHQGFSTYYRNSKGRVVFIMPFTNLEYWERVRGASLDDYERHGVAYVPAANATASV
ncbi:MULTISPECIES: flavin-containing monooxygenase [unclassified Rhodococcus (in: high G+C Gram-positive bacteria)]|uniref:flavin-containing monooxygenase n=1 Tax=unclassified Rhodococcus (in: high G+C Gram-positive bacteria) TaxID=192944 RepID=UPI0006F93819|nr:MULTISPECIES: NAD(P)/FAD-dependent oxidoreductase [unclassified Rhodococcus (in: high G+C Gram-positive bacteria)]KQU28448.1 monooxygenase [Rhodococcus sp. Leaf225]KQU47673.1 monooxygenase [Rhodococcus sp. Leaf258]